jgi:hypothetical protein
VDFLLPPVTSSLLGPNIFLSTLFLHTISLSSFRNERRIINSHKKLYFSCEHFNFYIPGSRISRQSAHKCGKVVNLTHRPSLAPERIPGTHFCYRLSRAQGHNPTGRIKSLKNSSDSIGNRTRDLPAFSAVPQPTAPPRTPHF